MSSRYYFTLILCAGMGAFPAQSNAQEAGIIDLTKRLKPFNAGNPPLPKITAAEKIARDRAIQRRLQYRQRRAALTHVARLQRFGKIDFATVSKAYHTKISALRQAASHRQVRRQQMALSKQRALAEVKALAVAMRQRFDAEQRAMAEVARQLRDDNPDYAEQALRRAAEATEQSAGKTITETENLPLLSKSVDLSYVDPIRRSEEKGELKTKQLTPSQPPGTQPGLTFIQPDDPATLKESAEIEARIAYKKQKALERIKQAREQTKISQASGSQTEQRQKLRELLDLYVRGKVEPSEYHRRRNIILGRPAPETK